MVCMYTRQKRACQKWINFVKENVNTKDGKRWRKIISSGAADPGQSGTTVVEVDKRKYQKNDGWALQSAKRDGGKESE